MKPMRMIAAILLFATSAFAQDDGAFGGLLGGDVGLSAPPVAAPRGAPAPARGAAPPAPDRLVRLKEALLKANAPLAREQEVAINALLDTEIPAMRRSLQSKTAELGVQPPAPATAPRGQPPVAARGGPVNLPNLDLKTETTLRRFIIGLQDQLLTKVAAIPALKPEQQAILKGLYKDQLRARGGLDAIQLALEDAGTPFTAEQMGQIQPLFDEQDLARAQLQQESQGQPDPARVAQLEQATLLKVVRLLTPSQRAALQAASARPRP